LTDSGLGVKTQRSPHENTVIQAGSQQARNIDDAQNRLKTVKHRQVIVKQFWYDGLNQIIPKNLNGNVTFHGYDALEPDRGME
jgi:hypothetical protein